MTTIFIVTGFKQKKDNVQFKWMRPYFTKLGFEVKVFAADWDYHVMSDYVENFKRYYREHKGKENFVLGFSYGAMIALLSAKELQPNWLYLCSLSPYFKEDMHKLRADWRKKIGVRRCLDFLKHDFKQVTKGLTIPTTVLYGENEGAKYPTLRKRCEVVNEVLLKSKLIIVNDAPHKIDHPEYIKAIKVVFE